MRYLSLAILFLAITGVVAAEVRTQEDAKKLADELSDNAPGKAASNLVCNLF